MAQALAGLGQAPGQRAERTAQGASRLGVGLAFEVTKHQGRAILLGQPGQFALKEDDPVVGLDWLKLLRDGALSRMSRSLSRRRAACARAFNASRYATCCNQPPMLSAQRTRFALRASTSQVA